MTRTSLKEARAAKRGVMDLLADKAKVVGVGITEGADGHAIKVNLAEPAGALPSMINGVPIIYEIVGKITTRW